jgi:hypothetical protein
VKRTAIALLLVLTGMGGGCASPQAGRTETPSVARFYLEANPGAGGTTVVLPVSGVRIVVEPTPVLIESDVAAAACARVDLGDCLALRFKAAASVDLLRLSTAARGRRLVLTIDGMPVGARRLDVALATGELLMFVELPPGDLPVLVRRLESGLATLTHPTPGPRHG